MAGVGPEAPDRQDGDLYHYLRIQVTPDALIVRPVGVRKVGSSYRREEPMPAFHAPSLPYRRPSWHPRILDSVTVRRNEPPIVNWK